MQQVSSILSTIKRNIRKYIANIFMIIGYCMMIFFVVWMIQTFPTTSQEGDIDYSLPIKAVWFWSVSLIFILLGMVLKLGKTTIKWCKEHLIKYILLFFSLMFLILLVDFIKIIFPADTKFKLLFIAGILLSAFLIFLYIKYVDEKHLKL